MPSGNHQVVLSGRFQGMVRPQWAPPPIAETRPAARGGAHLPDGVVDVDEHHLA